MKLASNRATLFKVLVFLATFLTVSVMIASVVVAQFPQYGRGEHNGYFHNVNDTAGTFVFAQGSADGTTGASVTRDCALPGGGTGERGNSAIAVDNVGGFIGTIAARLDSSNVQNRTGAAFIVNTMLGRDGGAADKSISSTSADFQEWEDRVRYYDDQGRIDLNVCRTFNDGFINSYFQGQGTFANSDDAFYDQNGTEVQLAMVFYDANGTDLDYVLKLNCGNTAEESLGLDEAAARIEVRKVNESGDSSADSLISGQGVTLGAGSPRYANPLTYNDIPTGANYTLSTTVPSGWLPSFSYCLDRTNCHSYPSDLDGNGSTRTFNIPPGTEYVDFYWHFDKLGEQANLDVQVTGLPSGSTVNMVTQNHGAGSCGSSFSVSTGSTRNCDSGPTSDGLACHNNSVNSSYEGIGCADGLRIFAPSSYGSYQFAGWDYDVTRADDVGRADNCSYGGSSSGQCVNLYPGEAATAVAIYTLPDPPAACGGLSPSGSRVGITSRNKEDSSQVEGPATFTVRNAYGWWYAGTSTNDNVTDTRFVVLTGYDHNGDGNVDSSRRYRYRYPEDGGTTTDYSNSSCAWKRVQQSDGSHQWEYLCEQTDSEVTEGTPVYDVYRKTWYSNYNSGNFDTGSTGSDGQITYRRTDDRGIYAERYEVIITGVPSSYYDQRINQHNWDGESDRVAILYEGDSRCIEMQPTWELATAITTDPGPLPLEPYQSSPYRIVTEVCNNSDTWDNGEDEATHTVDVYQNSQYVRFVDQRRLGSSGDSSPPWRFDNVFLNKNDCTTFEFRFEIDGAALRSITQDDETTICFRTDAQPDRRDNDPNDSTDSNCYDISVPRRPFFLALGNDVHAGANVTTGIADEICTYTNTASNIDGQTSGSAGTRGQYSVSASGSIDSVGSNNRGNSERYTFGRDGDYNIICRPDYRLLPTFDTGSHPVISQGLFGNNNQFPNNRITEVTPSTGITRINGMTVPKDLRKTILVNGDVEITGDIAYEDGYSTRNEIPALAIIATGEIRIARNVNSISGYLVSYDIVDTCGDVARDSSNWVDLCSEQLVVNGAVVGREILLRRTFGDALDSTNEPAEIFRFRPEAYLAPAPGMFGTAREVFDIELFNIRPPVF